MWDDPSDGADDAPTAAQVPEEVGSTSGPATTLVDDDELPHGQRFIFWVRGSVDGELGLPSFATITARNAAPTAAADAGYATPATPTRELIVPAALGVLRNDTDIDTAPALVRAVLVAPPSHGSIVLNPDGSFRYTPVAGFSGTDTFTYKANNGTWGSTGVPMSPDSAPVLVTIAVVNVNVNHAPSGTNKTVTIRKHTRY